MTDTAVLPALDLITFARPGRRLDRAHLDRAGADALLQSTGTVSVALSEGRIAVVLDGEKRLARWHPSHLHAIERVFLGREGGAALFATDVGTLTDAETADLLGADAKFIDLRSISPELSPVDAEIAATARALLGWHARHRFCAVCGGRTVAEEGGWRRRCESCGAMHFPRVDPVVIMLVLREDHVLIGRQRGWPEGLHSLLAGYVEPGEVPEDAVRREVMEEAAVPVGRVRYLASQPWPFPSTLMIGCVAEALAWPITIDPSELQGAEWVSRQEMADVLNGEHARLGAPRPDAIARNLLKAWVEGEIDGF